MLRKSLSAVALSAICLTQTASAHFIWVLTSPDGNPTKAQVFFSESAEPDDAKLLDKITGAQVWAVGQKPIQLKLAKSGDGLIIDIPAERKQATIALRHTYGVTTRGKEKFLLNYYAKSTPSELTGLWSAVKKPEYLPLEIVASKEHGSEDTVLQVLWQNKPLAGATVTVVGPGIEKKLEGTSDAKGNYSCKLPKSGVYSIRAKLTEKTPGEYKGEKYDSVSHYSTLTLPANLTRIAPIASKLPPLPQGVTSFGGAVAGDTVYIYGGNYGDGHHYHDKGQSGDLWSLNLSSPSKWEKSAEGPRIQGLAMVEFQGNIFRVGGFSAKNKEEAPQDLRSQTEFAKLDAANNKWISLPALPEARSSHDAAMIGNTLYVVGGWNLQGEKELKWHETALTVDLSESSLTWKTITTPPFQRRALALANHNGKLFCIGGMEKSGQTSTVVNIYDPATKAWSTGPNILGGGMEGFGCSAFASHGNLFVTTMSGSIQKLSKDGSKWEYLGQMEFGRFFHRLLPWRDSLISVGGASMMSGKVEKVELLPITNANAIQGN